MLGKFRMENSQQEANNPWNYVPVFSAYNDIFFSVDEVTQIAWVNIPLFDETGALRQGRYFAGLWPYLEDVCPDMKTVYTEPNRSACCPVLEIVFPEFPYDLRFPKPNSWIQAGNLNFTEAMPEDCGKIEDKLLSSLENAMCSVMFQRISYDDALRYRQKAIESFKLLHFHWKRDEYPFFAQFPPATLSNIRIDANSELNSPTKNSSYECQLPMPHQGIVDLLWAFRNLYTGLPNLLMSLLMDCLISWPSELSTQCDETSYGRFGKPWQKVLDELYSLMSKSRCPKASMALWLLGPGVADQGIRHWAVRSLATCSPDSLLALAPQLVQLMSYDLHFDWSGLFSLLVFRSSLSAQFANGLYWHLVPMIKHSTWHSNHRSLMLLSAIKQLISPRITKAWSRQVDVINQLNEAGN
ncbi:Phosphatidylinositol 4-phosphate 3-kinase C2 domain-containing subunit alpha [Cichlidogyrus casuarinus]|uniref:Phosphatidylinositol 4-phosphate 3-kinase C2 domain-containing subunit alpha n=1 Tax=Cichlidogyrus casuarinus TaxID=1844966 RepID=A0ABD2QAC9_9PLAT